MAQQSRQKEPQCHDPTAVKGMPFRKRMLNTGKIQYAKGASKKCDPRSSKHETDHPMICSRDGVWVLFKAQWKATKRFQADV